MSRPATLLPAGGQASPLVRGLRVAMAWMLALFVFTLPLAEAPKNWAAALFILFWALHGALARDLGGRWDRMDSAFALVFASAALSAWFGDARTMSATTRLLLVSWLVMRTPLSEGDGRRLFGAACAGLLIALVAGAVPYLSGHEAFLELPSVGHVNQSALYVAIMAAAALGWWLQARLGGAAAPGAWSPVGPGPWAALFVLGLLVTGSRAAILAAALAAGAILAAVYFERPAARDHRLLVRLALVFALLVVVAVALGALSGRSENKLTLAEMLRAESVEMRVQHWRIAWEGWLQRPWLGWGPDSFQSLRIEEICRWRALRGEGCDPGRYHTATHAHSLYAATLVERGVVGLGALAVLLATWGGALLRRRESAPASPWWVASTAAFVVVLVAGFWQTTLRVEHGSLALLALGVWWAGERARRGAAGP